MRAGSLKSENREVYRGKLGIIQVPNDLTPAALPPNLVPDLVVTIQPGEMVFNTPAPLSLPNLAGMDLWSINPETGDFDKVGVGRVSEDGTVVETIEGGIINSSWHFFTPPPDEPLDPELILLNLAPECDDCLETGILTSEVELHSGAVIETHELVPYQSLGVSRGLTLTYDSLRADPRPILHFGYENVERSRLAPGFEDKLRLLASLTVHGEDFEYEVPGFAGGEYGLQGGEHFWSLTPGSGPVSAALQADLSHLPSGNYPYSLTSGIRLFVRNQFNGSSSTTTGKLLHINGIESAFGSGWSLAGLLNLVENEDGSVLLIDGDGSELLFEAPSTEGDTYRAPAGAFSILEKLQNGAFRLTEKDKTVQLFNANNQLASVTDSDGNVTQYVYNKDGQISQIIDPVGLKTTFTYTSGKVTAITDPAQRVTQLKYDEFGNLISITDPDNSTSTWEYDNLHHMVAEVDQRGNREETVYNFAGRAVGATRKDGSVVRVNPVQTQGLYSPEATINPLSSPVARTTNDAVSSYANGNGNVRVTELDQAGQLVNARDGEGVLPSVARNEANLVTSRTDGRGFVTTYKYDEQGNVLQVQDRIKGGSERVFFDDFESGASSSWSDSRIDSSYPNVFTQFSGRFNHGSQTLTLATIPGETYTLEWDLYLLDSWDGSHSLYGPDYFNIDIDEKQVFHETFTNFPEQNFPQTFTESPYEIGSYGLTSYYRDSIYRDIQLTFTAQNATTTIRFSDELNFVESVSLGLADETWGIDNVEVKRLFTSNSILTERTYTYDPTFNQVTSVIDELGRVTLNEIDPENGNLLSVTRVVGEIGSDDDVITRYTYTNSGLMDTETDPLGRVMDYDYDQFGRLIQVTVAEGTSAEAIQRYEYDLAGNLTAVIDGNGNRSSYEYDKRNRLVKTTFADGEVQKIEYDSAGNQVATVDENGNRTQYTYNAVKS